MLQQTKRNCKTFVEVGEYGLCVEGERKKMCGKVPVVLADNGFDVIVVAVDPEPVLDGVAFVAYDFVVDPDDYNLDQPVNIPQRKIM